jgi:hypothetical protein
MTFEVRVVGGQCGFHIFFHKKANGDSGAIVVGDEDGNQSLVLYTPNGKITVPEAMVRNLQTDLGRWQACRLRGRGPQVRFEVNGEEWFSSRNESFSEGRIGFGPNEGTDSVAFRKMKVTTPDGEVMWQGP